MRGNAHSFGGNWTDEKLSCVKEYLAAYTTALKNQPFKLWYVDAFAGTGYRNIRSADGRQTLLFPDMAEDEAEAYRAGSAQIALESDPPFSEYHFIEQDAEKCTELEKLKGEYPDKEIHIHAEDANKELIKLCNAVSQQKRTRGVLFLDPYGMDVSWKTIETVAKTEAIDMWYLFPLGIGVNRLLRKDGDIPEGWETRLNIIFGCTDWQKEFYEKESIQGLFGVEGKTTKTADFKQVAEFFVKRLETIFAGVIKNPLPLYNSRNNPLYLLCFASGNRKGAKVALKIAKHILKE